MQTVFHQEQAPKGKSRVTATKTRSRLNLRGNCPGARLFCVFSSRIRKSARTHIAHESSFSRLFLPLGLWSIRPQISSPSFFVSPTRYSAIEPEYRQKWPLNWPAWPDRVRRKTRRQLQRNNLEQKVRWHLYLQAKMMTFFGLDVQKGLKRV